MSLFTIKSPHPVKDYLPSTITVDNTANTEIAEIDEDYTLITADDIEEYPTLEAACEALVAYATRLTSPQYVVETLGRPWDLRAEVNHALTIGFIRHHPRNDVQTLRESLREQQVQPMYHLNSLPADGSVEDWVAARLLTNQFILPYDPACDEEWREDNTAYRNADVHRDPDTQSLFGRTRPLTLNEFGFLWTESNEDLFIALAADNVTIPTVYTTANSITADRTEANAYSYRMRRHNYDQWLDDQPSPYAVLDRDSLGSMFKRLPYIEGDPYLVALYAMVYNDAYQEGLTRKGMMAILREDYPRYLEELYDHQALRLLAYSYTMDATPLNYTVPIRQVEWVAVGTLSAIVNTENGWTDYLTHIAGRSGKRIPPLPEGVTFPMIVTARVTHSDTLLADAVPLSSVTTALRTVGLQ